MPEVSMPSDVDVSELVNAAFADAPGALAIVADLDKLAARQRIEAEVNRQQLAEMREKRDNLRSAVAHNVNRTVASEYQKEHDEARAKLEKGLENITAEIVERTKLEPTVKLVGIDKQRVRIRASLNSPAPGAFLAAIQPRQRFADAPATVTKANLADVRKRQTKIVDELAALESAPLDPAAIDARIDSDVASIARGPSITNVFTFRDRGGGLLNQGHVGWPVEINPSQPDIGIQMLSWLFGDLIAEKLKQEARQRMTGVEGVGVAERKQRDADLRTEYLELQRQEVRLCRENFESVPAVNALAFFEIVRGADAPMKPAPEIFDPGANAMPSEVVGAKYSGLDDQRLVPKHLRKQAATTEE